MVFKPILSQLYSKIQILHVPQFKMDEVCEIVCELKSGMFKKVVILILEIVNQFESYHKKRLFSLC